MASCGADCKCFYDLLLISVEPDDHYDDISFINSAKRRYKSLILKVHPDKIEDTRAHTTTAILNKAIKVIGNRSLQQEYRKSGLRNLGPCFGHNADDVATAKKFIHERVATTCLEADYQDSSTRATKLSSTATHDIKHPGDKKLKGEGLNSGYFSSSFEGFPFGSRRQKSSRQTMWFPNRSGIKSKINPNVRQVSRLTPLETIHSKAKTVRNEKREAIVVDHAIIQGETYFLVRIDGSGDLRYKKLSDILSSIDEKHLLSYLINLESTNNETFLSLLRFESCLDDLYERAQARSSG